MDWTVDTPTETVRIRNAVPEVDHGCLIFREQEYRVSIVTAFSANGWLSITREEDDE